MFQPTDPQTSLFEAQFLIPPEKAARLARSWAEPFRTRILPLIDEEVFRDAFCPNNGRPNTSIRLLVCLHLLRDWHDLTDGEVVEQFEYNLQWQYALGVEPAAAHVSEKTLWTFRQLLKSSERGRKMFEGVTRGLAEQDGLRLGKQRLDSTHVVPNIAVLTRLGLFVETVTAFLLALRREVPSATLAAGYTKRYLDREGSFSDAKRSQAARRLEAVAQDVFRLVRRFEGDKVVSALPAFATLRRLFEEQCIVVKDDGPDGGSAGEDGPADDQLQGERVMLREAKEIGGDSLQTPHDVDATYGHKGKGYEVQVAETCDEHNPYQLITATSVNGANESDHGAVKPMLDQLKAAKLMPDTLIADTAYGSGTNIVHCAVRDVELIAPVQTGGAKKTDRPELDLSDFAFDTVCRTVLFCPAGHAPATRTTTEERCRATFAQTDCADCQFAPRCPTRELADGRRQLHRAPATIATELRQVEQTQGAFKDQYRIRSGIESTNNELKHTHGLGRLRIRGKPQVTLAALLKALALNVKRAVRHHVSKLTETVSPPCLVA